MKHFTDLKDAYSLCEAIGSGVRMDILEQILEHKSISMQDLARNLHLTGGALTAHIRKLESVGLVHVSLVPGKRGVSKMCSIALDKVLIDITSTLPEKTLSFRVPVGQYRTATARGRCALVGAKGFLGETDAPRYFTYPEHVDCLGLWLTDGEIVYTLPAPPADADVIEEVRFHFEISAAAGGDLPGRVSFRIGDVPLGTATLPSEAHDRRGALNPDWYDTVFPQYGSLKTLSVNARGCYWDGVKISEVTLAALHGLDTLAIASNSGFMLYGGNLGDYATDLNYILEFQNVRYR